jgi:cardiolipin synthase
VAVPLRFIRSIATRLRPAPAVVGRTDLRYVHRHERLIGENQVSLLRSGEEGFPSMLEAIRGARRRVLLETYILRSDATGKRFQEALLERARAGVRVRLMFDSVGSFGLVTEEYLSELASAGVDVLEYHPITPWRKRLLLRLRKLRASADLRRGRPSRPHVSREPGQWSLNRRDHQKILVVDDRVAFTGGLNVGDEYAPRPEGGGWYDLQVRIEGPAARAFADLFHQAWLDGGGEPFEQPVAQSRSRWAPVLVHTCDNFRMRNRSRMHASYRHAIRNAHASIAIMNAYFVPDQLLRWALANAVRRGVSVRVMVPSNSDVRFVWYASRYLFARLLRAGVRIFEYEGKMMHAKAGVIDGIWSTIGSYNLDRRSMLHNLEAGVVVLDPGFAASLEREFDACLAQCREITLPAWRRRPRPQRAMEWFAHLFAYWL